MIFSSNPEEELLPCDQYESLWTDFLASLQTGNDNPINNQQDEQYIDFSQTNRKRNREYTKNIQLFYHSSFFYI